MPPEQGGCAVQLFSYTRTEVDGETKDDSVQSSNHALQIVDSLCRNDKNHQDGAAVIKKGEPPRTPGHTPLWIIQIQVRNTHKGVSSYHADFSKFAGCPNDCAEYMMDIFGTVKGVLRRARNDLRARRAEKKAKKEGGNK